MPGESSLSAHPVMPSTRAMELDMALDCLARGRSVLVTALPGDGAPDFARSLAARINPDGHGLLNAVNCLGTSEVTDFLGQTGPGVIEMMHLLPDETGPAIGTALAVVGARPVAYVVDADRLASADHTGRGPFSQVATAWTRGILERIDLSPLGDDEIGGVIDAILPRGVLDDLQRATLIRLAEGQPVVAVDLAEEARVNPGGVPRRIPRAGVDPLLIGRRAMMRTLDRYANLPNDVAEAALRIAVLSPLPTVTAVQLVQLSSVSRLRESRLVSEVDVDGHKSLVVSPIHTLGLVQSHPELAPIPGASLPEVEISLWRAGYPMGNTWMQTMARHLLQDRRRRDDAEVRLFIHAAELGNCSGRPAEAAVLEEALNREIQERRLESEATSRRDVTRLPVAELELAVDRRALATHLVAGRYHDAIEVGRRVLEECSAQLADAPISRRADAHHALHLVSLALAWSPRLPDWYEPAVSRLEEIAPMTATVLRGYAADGRIGSADFRPIAESLIAPPELRFAAMGVLAIYHLNRGDGQALRAVISQGDRLGDELGPGADGPGAGSLYDAKQFFTCVAAIVRVLAGIPDRARCLDAMLADAIGPARRTSWPTALEAAFTLGVTELTSGDQQTGMRDLVAAADLLGGAMLPDMFYLVQGLGMASRLTLAGSAEALDWRRASLIRRPELRDPFWAIGRTVRQPQDDPSLSPEIPEHADLLAAPAWLEALLLEDGLVSGEITVASARRGIDAVGPTSLPGVEAVRAHAYSLTEEDEGAITEAGAMMTRAGRRQWIDHAVVSARSGFHESPSAPSLQIGGAPLTPREKQICGLVAEGLTNAEIARRLVLSVRTVESHVFTARGKLGARRRSDIPGRLADEHAGQ